MQLEKARWDKRNAKEYKIIDLPDLSFVQHCQQKFGINRGIYNTIDECLFNKGIVDIGKRRNTVLKFLAYLHHCNGISKNGQIKVGNRGLSSRLNEFWKDHFSHEAG